MNPIGTTAPPTDGLSNGLAIDNDTFKRLEEEQLRVTNAIVENCMMDVQIREAIKKNVDKGKPRLEIEITDFDRIWPGTSKMILTQPAVYLPAVNAAVRELYTNMLSNPPYNNDEHFDRRPFRDPRIGLKGWLRGNTITPRGLRANKLNRVVAVEGIVTRCGTAKHKVMKSVYVAEASQKRIKVDYVQEQFFKPTATSIAPVNDADGNRFLLEPGLTEFQNYQTFTIQEMPENAPSGQLPCSVEVTVTGDLVDAIKAGDRISVWGVYRAKLSRDDSRLSGGARCWIEANNIEHLGGNQLTMQVEPHDMALIRKIAKRPDTLVHLAHSIAPTLFGGLEKKKGLLLQLVGGTPKSLENNTMRVRGDINILLIGDPSCGKSQMLRFMMQVSPLSISTTGRGSSGVGLTAAARVDEENKGERVLEAGAMVMADGGLVCIDEFDKMSNDDRTAIHEVMEQQTVSISKASIQTTLNARCSVLAAANPTYGCFDDTRDIRSQICFPDSLMSRFDLIYLVHESSTPAEDRRICRTVLSNHIHKANQHALVVAGSNRGAQFSGLVNRTDWTILPRDDPTTSTQNYDRQTPEGDVIYSIPFLKKYLQVAKAKQPELTDEAIDSISNYYTQMRKHCVESQTGGSGRGRFAVPTARTLEATIRLSTAHAKLCLKNKIDLRDVRAAKKLLHYSLLGEEYESDDEIAEREEVIESKKRTTNRKRTDGGSRSASTRKRPATVEADKRDTIAAATRIGVKRQKRTAGSDLAEMDVEQEPSAAEMRSAYDTVVRLKETEEVESLMKSELFDMIVAANDGRHIEDDVFETILKRLCDDNKLADLGEEGFWMV